MPTYRPYPITIFAHETTNQVEVALDLILAIFMNTISVMVTIHIYVLEICELHCKHNYGIV